MDLDLLDFQKKVNTDLVGKFINIASRSQGFLKQFDNKTSSVLDEDILDLFASKKEEIFNHYQDRNYSKALKEVMSLADQANQYFDKNEPWILNKDPKNKDEVHKIASTALNLFRILNLYLEHVIPKTSATIKQYLKSEDTIKNIGKFLKDFEINAFSPLITRIEDDDINKLIEACKNG